MTANFKVKRLDKSTPVPLYYQLKEEIIRQIKDGSCPADSPLPTEMEFSDMFSISRTTVRQAITELAREGWVYRIKSKGTFVSEPKLNQDFISKLLPFEDEMKKLGKVPSTKLLEMKICKPTDQAAEHLGISLNAKVLYLNRLRFADGEPVVTVETYLPCDYCLFVRDHDLEHESLYRVMSQQEETTVYSITRRVEAVEATAADVKYLGMKKGKPVQLFYSVGYNKDRKPMEFSVARYRADKSSFEVTVYADRGQE